MPIHQTAIVDPIASIDASATIGPFVVVEGPVQIGAGTVIGPGCHLLGQTTIGKNCRIHARVSIGDFPQDRDYGGEESYCEIGPDCIIREGVTIHRATGEGEGTTVGPRCMLMTNSHVAHNCSLGADVTLVSGALLGGHVQVGDQAVIGGNVGVHQFVRIGNLAMIGAVAMISQDIPPFMLTDHFGHVVGVNQIGLRRAGLSPAARSEVKAAFRVLYREGHTPKEGFAFLTEQLWCDALDPLLAFWRDDTARGVSARRVRIAK